MHGTIWVNYSIHGPPPPPTQNFQIWPRTAPGPTPGPRAHRGEKIPPSLIEIRCNRTEIWPKNGLAHVCSSLPRIVGTAFSRRPPPFRGPPLAPEAPGPGGLAGAESPQEGQGSGGREPPGRPATQTSVTHFRRWPGIIGGSSPTTPTTTRGGIIFPEFPNWQIWTFLGLLRPWDHVESILWTRFTPGALIQSSPDPNRTMFQPFFCFRLLLKK